MTVKGIEVAGIIYDNEDETARSTATEAASTARTASQTATQASETATTASQTATQASETATQADGKATENANAISELQSDMETLEDSALNPQLLSIISIALNTGYSAYKTTIENLAQVGKVLIGQFILQDIAGANIGTTKQAVIGSCSLRPTTDIYAVGIDYSSGSTVRIQLLASGEVRLAESPNVISGANSIRIPFTAIV